MAGRLNANDVSAANAEVSVSLTPASDEIIRGGVVIWSYSGTPTGGGLTIYSDITELVDIDITAGGPGFLPLDGLNGIEYGEELNISLNAGGGGIIGKLNVIGRATK